MPRLRVALALGAAGLCALGLLVVAVYSAIELARFERAEVRRSLFVYAAGQTLVRGLDVRRIDLAGTLGRLGYMEVPAPAAPGQFRRGPAQWDIARRDEPGRRIRLEIREGRIARVVRDGAEVDEAALEGEVIAGGDRGGEDFIPIRFADVPQSLVDAVLAAEDHRFFSHGAIDARGLARAAWVNLRRGRVVQGGSTITQQLVKNRLLTPKRTVLRKAREAWLSVLVEWRYSKPRILEAYLNEIYLGQRGGLAIRGVGAAARAYFAKDVRQLTPGEAAMLAGMVRAPTTYSPLLDPARARDRRAAVLAQMRELGMFDARAYERARREPLRVSPGPMAGQAAPYFVDHVRRELEGGSGGGATRVDTSLDLGLQRFAEAAVARGLDQLESRYPRLRRRDPRARLQVAFVALDPTTGEIRALVGGRDYQASQFNRVTLARRQPGSAFKPFVFLAALRPHGGSAAFTAASMLDDTPVTVAVGGRPWSPRNYEDHYEGRVTLRRALELSLNAATVRLGQAVGPTAVVEVARRLGMEERSAPVPAVALGAFEIAPLDLARAYVPLANGGMRPGAIHAVRTVVRPDGERVDSARSGAAERVISPAEAYLVTSLLMGVIRSGTASSAQDLESVGEVAGKTGTTNEGRDAWFVGYSSRLLAAVWVGFDDGQVHGLSGAQAALPIWADFMRQALAAYPSPAFAVPAGISFADIDPTNGKLATSYCPLRARETFLVGTEPEPCAEHREWTEPLVEWWRWLRDRLPH